MSELDDERETIECPECAAEYVVDSYCGECGYGREVDEVVEAMPAVVPVVARPTEARAFPAHEAAWCPHCLTWLGTFASVAEAREEERSLADHPVEFCQRRRAGLNSSEEWRLRHRVGALGSLAANPPAAPRVAGVRA